LQLASSYDLDAISVGGGVAGVFQAGAWEAWLMHIPDGYLSPSTCATFYGASVPIWVTAGRRVKKVVRNRYVPLVAIGAAYSFLVMMFNVPIPDGTTAHAVGAVLIAVLLGPWAAVIAVSIALLIQALFFGDGGILAYGANVFNMAFVMPMVGYGVYRAVVHRNFPLTSPRRPLGAAIGPYVGINAAALCAAVEFGIQPVLFTSANGTPLYAPFHLSQTIPAMMLAHLVVAGVVDAVLTAGVITYLQKANLPVLQVNRETVPDEVADEAPKRLGWRWGLIGLGVMAVLTPLGLVAPGGAFGESAPTDLDLKKYHLGAVPSGLRHYAGFWHNALFDGYDFSHDKHPTVGYLASAAIGLLVIAVAVFLVFKLVGVLRGGAGGDLAPALASSFPGRPAVASILGAAPLPAPPAPGIPADPGNGRPGPVALTFTATVRSGDGVPGGSVTFSHGATTLGTVPVDRTGRATLTATFRPGGGVVTAVYNGDGTAAVSAAAISVDGPVPTTTELHCSAEVAGAVH
jgi:cobalt/nickel transport system permease protein